MSTAPTPTPEPTPEPRSPISCPSCGSRYNPETRELVEDTGLREEISRLESEAVILRRGLQTVHEERDEALRKLAALEAAPLAPAPAPREKKSRDFIVGER